jgi:hypothetical protein
LYKFHLCMEFPPSSPILRFHLKFFSYVLISVDFLVRSHGEPVVVCLRIPKSVVAKLVCRFYRIRCPAYAFCSPCTWMSESPQTWSCRIFTFPGCISEPKVWPTVWIVRRVVVEKRSLPMHAATTIVDG